MFQEVFHIGWRAAGAATRWCPFTSFALNAPDCLTAHSTAVIAWFALS